MVMDADNLIYPSCLRKLADALGDHPDVDAAYAILEDFGEQRNIRSALAWDVNRLCRANYIDAQSMFRKSTWERLGGYRADDEHLYGWEDWDLWLRLADEGGWALLVTEILGRYRVQRSSMITLTNLATDDAIAAMRKRHPNCLPAGPRNLQPVTRFSAMKSHRRYGEGCGDRPRWSGGLLNTEPAATPATAEATTHATYESLYEAHARSTGDEGVGGGDYDVMGEVELDVLRAEGLQPTSTLLDFGCGNGRLAVHAVPYLDARHLHRHRHRPDVPRLTQRTASPPPRVRAAATSSWSIRSASSSTSPITRSIWLARSPCSRTWSTRTCTATSCSSSGSCGPTVGS